MFHFLDPIFIIKTLGLIGIIIFVFAESGLFFGFFLPGDSLLFTAGLLASQGILNITILVVACTVAAIFGDSVGYSFGKYVGPRIFKKEDSFFFHKKHLKNAGDFYEKYGAKAIILARFVPIVRTFAPIVAGVGQMKYKKFLTFNVVGGVFWTTALSLLGYFIGRSVSNVDKYLLPIIAVIIVISFLPILREMYVKR
jgi:membrane-associated protein